MLALLLSCSLAVSAQSLSFSYTVGMQKAAERYFEVDLTCEGLSASFYDFKIPVWMPGYYQQLPYAAHISELQARDFKTGKPLKWEKANHNTWRIYTDHAPSISLHYQVKGERSFVATNFIDPSRAFIAPTGLFLHIDGALDHPVKIRLLPKEGWQKVATGLESVKDHPFTFIAPDFDVLYDSPMLIGNLEEMPAFHVRDVPHFFIGYQLGTFNHQAFMDDLKKVVEVAVDLFDEIPFKHYTFIGIGPGGGGIEHLNSSAVAFSGGAHLDKPTGRLSMLSFLGHEYYHHYNAKRIRPVELGPFDYDHGSRTNMLWVAEGITAYYDEMLLKWAGLVDSTYLFKTFQQSIAKYENAPGKRFQSVSQASYDTWSDGPFGRTGDEFNKTVSYYDKGPVLGLMLDFRIRHESKNRHSLNDVMYRLYHELYKKFNRGYTEAEFKAICEEMAGCKLDDFFEYVYTVKTPDYARYFAYAGLDIAVSPQPVADAWLGIKGQEKDGKILIREVEWESPAWKEGIRRNQVLHRINGEQATMDLLNQVVRSQKKGAIVQLEIIQNEQVNIIPLILAQKEETSFYIRPKKELTKSEREILQSWLKERTRSGKEK